ncbi:MAG: cytidine deaminase [Bacteroidaceae bacterium]|nr:cytidine deaminase [Bacteroidaceae bacterium]
MKEVSFEYKMQVCHEDELSVEDKQLIDAAREACKGSYSPYSGFSVGAALRLSDDEIIKGSNQENAAYPSGMCAERVALYQAGAIHPHKTIKSLAIAARTKDGFTSHPCPPCGACRQVMMESEMRNGGTPIRIILYGTQVCYIIEGGAKFLLPLQFEKETMNTHSQSNLHRQ